MRLAELMRTIKTGAYPTNCCEVVLLLNSDVGQCDVVCVREVLSWLCFQAAELFNNKFKMVWAIGK